MQKKPKLKNREFKMEIGRKDLIDPQKSKSTKVVVQTKQKGLI